MKRNDIKALHDQTIPELNQRLVEISEELIKARLEKGAAKLTNLRLVSTLADDLARVKTILGEKMMVQQIKSQVTKRDLRQASKDNQASKKDK